MPPTPRPTRADRTRAATGIVAAPPSRTRAVPASSLSGMSSASTNSEGAAGTLVNPLMGTTNNNNGHNNDAAIPAVGTQARPRQRKPWTEIEVEALLQGVKKYGIGGWVSILSDPDLAFDARRTSVDLKDKWRVLTTRRSRRSKGPLIDFASLPRAYKPHGARARAPRLPLDDAPAGTAAAAPAAPPAGSGSGSGSASSAEAPRAHDALPVPPASSAAAGQPPRGPVDPPVPWPAAPALPCGTGTRSGSGTRTHASHSPPAVATAADAYRTSPHMRDGRDRAWPYPSSRDTWAAHPYWPPPLYTSSAAAAARAASAARGYPYPPSYAAYPGSYGVHPLSPHDGYDACPPRPAAMRPSRRVPDHHGYPGSPIEHDLSHPPPPPYPFFDPYAYAYYAPPPAHGYPVPPPPAGYRARVPPSVGVRSPPETFWEYPAYPAGGPRMTSASASPTEWSVPGWRGGEHAHANRVSVDGGRVV
ncbi:hypothetical protein AMAG_14903 [Allomyces macrogynus ATCC 38327]|uniref:Myb-like domain-containing protein n=1 Tax=Allomyces macrogynus (strain ATCC 38327) TaxID=578462 RepID=A0A0L0T7R0_ALLM3|nr:hypothetical protein AMAG_14903 [Allomyces macrogynus ATCC 38327]|eukprot:KNE70782.1 hypothetical protein AMAG_14903 [Allomyces macrogynus ATCC 38327]